MRNIILLILFSLGISNIYSQNVWYVKPFTSNLHTNGDGLSFDTAWSIQNAFNNPGGVIQPGDIIYLKGGVYLGKFNVSSALQGTVNNYITVMSYPGEWAILNGNTADFIPPPSVSSSLSVSKSTSLIEDKNEIENEINSNEDDEFQSTGPILAVTSKYVMYKEFELTCLDPINRLEVINDSSCSTWELSSINKISGINHTENVNKFVNLVIRNVPSTGIGSWKATEDTEIYGCIIYKNGYIRKVRKENCDADYIGKGFGIYTQNNEGNPYRIIENNIFMNNYDSGIGVWSGNSSPTSKYLHNYNISKNIFINNGGPQRDETANLLVRGLSWNNRPENILVYDNIFYNNRLSGKSTEIRLTNGVHIYNNFMYKGQPTNQFHHNNRNLYMNGNTKILRYFTINNATPSNFSEWNWNFLNNKYLGYLDDNINSRLIRYLDNSDNNNNAWYSLLDFQNLYNSETNSTYQLASTYINNNNQGITFFIHNNEEPIKTITQNKYNPNRFYITIYNPRANTSIYDNVSIDLSEYNIPEGRSYTIIDPENYFNPNQITDIYNGSSVSLPMTLTSMETLDDTYPQNYRNQIVHTLKDFSAFILDFGCNHILFDQTINNQIDNSNSNYEVRNNLKFLNYTCESVVLAEAGKSILIQPNSHITSNSDYLARIIEKCPLLTFYDNTNLTQYKDNISKESNSEKKQYSNDENYYLIEPNPSYGVFKVKSLIDEKIEKIEIIDSKGVMVYSSRDFIKNSKNEYIEVNIEDKPSGVYFLNIYSTKKHTIKVIKK